MGTTGVSPALRTFKIITRVKKEIADKRVGSREDNHHMTKNLDVDGNEREKVTGQRNSATP